METPLLDSNFNQVPQCNSSPGPSPSPNSLTIALFIVIRVSFTTPEVQVSEDDPTGETEVCLEGDTESAQPYTVQLAQMPSGDNPATGEWTAIV